MSEEYRQVLLYSYRSKGGMGSYLQFSTVFTMMSFVGTMRVTSQKRTQLM